MSGYSSFNEDTGNSDTSINVTSLLNDRYYQFKVSAKSLAGTGTSSETVSAIAPRIGPSTPTGVYGAPENLKVTVYWTASNDNGGSPIAGYKVEYAESPYTTWNTSVASTSSSPYTVENLQNGTAYKFRVSAKNSFVYGSPSTVSQAQIPTPFSATNDPAGTYQIVTANGYKNHIFTGSGKLIVTGTKNVDFLIVAGGGAGGYKLGGGGGGGGVISGTNYPLYEHADLDIVVGAGAAGPTTSTEQNNSSNTKGQDSSIIGTQFNFKAYGGGGGGGDGDHEGNPGGSGGGHGWSSSRNPSLAKYWQYNSYTSVFDAGDMPTDGEYTITTSSGTVTAYGNKGGQHGGHYVPSAGGGAGQVGGGTSTSDHQYQAHGGDGIQIAWVTPQALGHSGSHNGVGNTTAYYWGGGGGANNHNNRWSPSGSGDGGKGGGGAGQRRYGTNGVEGVARSGGYADASLSNAPSSGPGGDGGTNTGGGGGGGDYNSTPHNGGSGGSGIVVIRYASSVTTAPSGLLNLQNNLTGVLALTVSWSGPEDNGGPGTLYYRVEYAADPYSTWNSLATGITSTSYTKSELTDGTNYKFRVYTTNDIGESTAVVSSPQEAKTTYVYHFVIAKENNDGLGEHIEDLVIDIDGSFKHIGDITGASITVNFTPVNGEKEDIWDNDTGSRASYDRASTAEVGETFMTIQLPSRANAFEMEFQRPKYAPGYKILEFATVVLNDTTSSRSNSQDPQNVRYKYEPDYALSLSDGVGKISQNGSQIFP